MTISDNKQVARNAAFLALRMVFVTIVGLYTSRIVLNALGVDDYGIYGVIGGVVGMASFLNSSMAGATSRFITFELGRGDKQKLRIIFSTSLIIHFMIAIAVALIAETIGLWFVNNGMNFPEERMFAVNVLYQFTIISMMVSFTQVPYTAAIIAHERMSIYAYIEIVNVALKLVTVHILLIADTDRLILYASLQLIISLLIALIYRIYCVRHFPETHFIRVFDRPVIKEMLKFSGVNLYGHLCVIAKNQGQPIILNIFFGIIANAGSALALTITGAVTGLTTSILQAFRPRIIKQYSIGNIHQSELTAKRAVQFTLIAYSVFAIPIIIETPTLLMLWLGQIPTYSVSFIRLIMVASIINVVVNVNNACIHATGNIKNISLINGTCYLLCPVLSYIWMKLGGDVTSIYCIDAIMLTCVSILGLYFIKIQIPGYNIKDYFKSIFNSVLVLVLGFIITLAVCHFTRSVYILDQDLNKWIAMFISLATTTLISFIICTVLTWLLIFDKSERIRIKGLMREKVSIICKN